MIRGLSDELTTALTGRGYRVLQVFTGQDGLRNAYSQGPNVVLLDLGLPDMDGIEVLGRLRGVSDVPVIIVSARNGLNDHTLALTRGADDYLVKPFGLGELVARIERAQRGRQFIGQWQEKAYDDGLLRVDFQRREVLVAGKEVALTSTEFRLLEALVQHVGIVQSVDTLLSKVWDDPRGKARSRVKFAVSRLRRKLETTPLGSMTIVSARGVGYLYRAPLPARRTAGSGLLYDPNDGDTANSDSSERRDVAVCDQERVARDLHDIVVQRLFTIGIGLQSIQQASSPSTREKLGRLVEGLDDAIGEIRRLIVILQGN